MTFTFRPAKRTNAKPLIGIYSESGCGKTTSALMLACGFVGGDMSKVGMIETESGRGEALAGHPTLGGYQVLSLREDFSPKAYGQAITAAEKAGFTALLLDSASHEWEGANGVLAMAAMNQEQGKKGPLVWQRPKIEHQREFMLRLMQTTIPLIIVCMRAKYPMKEQKNARGEKEWIRSSQLEPKQADDILFEMFVHGWIDQEHKFHGTKYTLPELRQCITDGEPITEESGRKLAAWASGSAAPRQTPAVDGPPPSADAVAADLIGTDEALALEARCTDNGIDPAALKKAAGVARFSLIKASDLERANKWIDAAIARRDKS